MPAASAAGANDGAVTFDATMVAGGLVVPRRRSDDVAPDADQLRVGGIVRPIVPVGGVGVPGVPGADPLLACANSMRSKLPIALPLIVSITSRATCAPAV